MSKGYEYQDDEIRSATRDQNRALRISNRNIRRREREQRERADTLYYELLQADGSRDAATEAFGKLWRSGAFDCGPQDYDFMVEVALEAIRIASGVQSAGTCLPEVAQVSCEPNEA